MVINLLLNNKIYHKIMKMQQNNNMIKCKKMIA